MRAGIFAFLLSLSGLAGSAFATVYNGNGGTGFGGPIGNGALTVTDGGSDVNFSLTPGIAFTGNVFVLYVDSVIGGDNSNSNYTDVADGGRRAISGLSGAGRALFTISSLFGADFAIHPGPGGFFGTF